MPAAPPDSPPTTVPPATATDFPARRRPLWPLPLLALLGWFVGLAPWFVARRSVGTFGTPWNPRNDMREALLPFHHERLVLLLTVVLLAGALAGCASFWTAPPRRRRLAAASLVVLATALGVAGSVAQTLSLHPDLGGTGTTEHTVQTALVLLTATAAAAGLLVGLLAGLGSPAVRLLAVAPLAVIAANWVGLLVTVATADSSPPVRHDTLPTVLAVLTGVLVGLGLGFGPRPRSRRAALVPLLWVGALALVWLTQSAFTAVRYFLENAARGNRVDSGELRELARDVGRLALDTFTPATAPWREAAVAVIVAVIVLVVVLVAVPLVRTTASPGRARTQTHPGGDGAPD